MTAKIAVCIPAYNGARFIATAVESVLHQSFNDYTLTVVDDCSSDGTAEIVQGLDGSRVSLLRNEKNLGLVGNWNRCVDVARDELVLLLHQDDVLGPSFLADVVRFFDQHPGVGLVSTAGLPIDSRGRVNTTVRLFNPRYRRRARGARVLSAGYEAIMYLLRYGVAVSGVVVRKSAYETVGTFDTAFPYSADEEMWIRIASRYAVGVLQDTIVYQRNHSGQFRDATWTRPDFLEQYLAVQRRRVSHLAGAEGGNERELNPSYLVARSGSSVALRLIARGDSARAAAFLDAAEALVPAIRRDAKHKIARMLSRTPVAGRWICRSFFALK